MPILISDILQHSNSVNAAIDSNFVRGGIRSSYANWTDFLATVDTTPAGTAGNISDQLKALSTLIWIGDASTGTFYVLTDYAGRDIPYGTTNTGWKKLSEVTGATATTTLIDSADENATHYLVFANSTAGAVNLETDESITYNPLTNLLTVTASQANQWTTARTVSFAGGDVTGSFSINGSADVSNVSLTIAANSVALGADTFGDYVSTLAAGTGVTLTNGAGGTEGAQYTVALDYAGTDSFIGAAAPTTEAVATGDFILIADTSDSGNVKKTALSNLPFTNYSAASITAGTGLSGGGTLTSGGTVTLDLDFSELTDMTGDISGTTEFILQNGAIESRKSANEIQLSKFVNDAGWTSNTGSVTSVGLTAGTGITITGTSPITTSGSFEVALTNSSVTIGSTNIALGATSPSLAGLTGLDFTANSASIAASIGANTLTLGGSASTVSVPGALSVAGNLTVSGTVTYVNSTNTYFKDNFIQLNRPVSGSSTVGALANTYTGISVFNVDNTNATVSDDATPGIRYHYSDQKWQIRTVNDGTYYDILTTATQSTLTAASIAEVLQATVTNEYVAPNTLRTFTSYSTSNIGINFPGANVSNAASTTYVQYAKTVKSTATATTDDATNGYLRVYHGLGNTYPVVFCYKLTGSDYFMMIPRVEAEDLDYVQLWIQGLAAGDVYYLGIIG
jgi:hypothetical protein